MHAFGKCAAFKVVFDLIDDLEELLAGLSCCSRQGTVVFWDSGRTSTLFLPLALLPAPAFVLLSLVLLLCFLKDLVGLALLMVPPLYPCSAAALVLLLRTSLSVLLVLFLFIASGPRQNHFFCIIRAAKALPLLVDN